MDVSEKEFWGASLRPWLASATQRGLGDADRAYLANVGLPVGIDWDLEVVDPTQPNQATPGYVVLAHNGPVPICVCPDTGHVVAREDGAERMVNSSVRCFGQCLMFYQDYRLRVRRMDDSDEVGISALIDEISRKMSASDRAAMADRENYWSVIVEQMRHGQL